MFTMRAARADPVPAPLAALQGPRAQAGAAAAERGFRASGATGGRDHLVEFAQMVLIAWPYAAVVRHQASKQVIPVFPLHPLFFAAPPGGGILLH